MTMTSTKYPNNIRTVSGLNVAVFNNDVVLACDTSVGACSINLDEIPSNYWSTTWKLYVYDLSNNASVNNITINAGSGQKINNASSLVLSSNGEGALIRILANGLFIAEATNFNGIISATDSSTIDFTVTGNDITGVVKYKDTSGLAFNTSDANTNYYPKVQIYNPAGTVSASFYGDIQYAASLGTHDIKNYSVIAPTGNFTSASVDNTTGYITIPTAGKYLIFANLRAIINNSTSLGSASLRSNNTNTTGIGWNNNPLNRTAYMQLSVCLKATDGTANRVTKYDLTDVGDVKIASPTVFTTLPAGQQIKIVVLNNSDLDYYGAEGSGLNVTIAKISD